MGKKKTSQSWMAEHVTDRFVQQAKKAGYRSRAAYKLSEIAARYPLFKSAQLVVDLGSTPGGWSQIARESIDRNSRLVAIDCLAMEPIKGVEFIQGDFTEIAVLEMLVNQLNGQKADVVISDMAPNITGVAAVDQAKSMGLCELALEFAIDWLKPSGVFLVKVFQGAGYPAFHQLMKQHFQSVVSIKPKASRDRSAEIYLLGHHLRS